jgi:glycosyltransferase involved in cell wall biosynthesis
MYTDLSQEFASKGHSVYVAVANGNAEKTRLRDEGGISVLRVRTMELFETSLIKKGLGNVLLPLQVYRGIFKFWSGRTFDSIIVSTPPITYLNTILKLKRKFNSGIYLILRDIFPQNAIDLEILKNTLLIRYFRKQEKKLYRLCDYIGCMSQGNIEYVKRHNAEISEKKLHLLPNWKKVNVNGIPDWSLKNQFGLKNSFIALYGGNFGKPQQAEFILALAKKMSDHEDVVFLLVGKGSEKQKIIDLAGKMGLKNVLFKDSLPRHQYDEVVKFCDIGLINLSEKFSIPNIPSRALSYWEAKLPILAAIDTSTDFNKILEESKSGLWSITGDLESYVMNFEKLYSDRQLRSEMGANGYRYLLENCTVSRACSIISEKLVS